jgi:hypothetical protein
MKRQWRGVSIIRNKSSDKGKHVEAPLSLIPFDEGKLFQPCSPLAHDVEESIHLDDDEFQDPVEDVHASTPPAHKEKEMIIYVDGLVKETLDIVDEHINTFIQTSRRRWDLGCPIFYRDPIYDIEDSPQEKGFELSSSKDYFSCVCDSYV